jgi:hypothetical protein
VHLVGFIIRMQSIKYVYSNFYILFHNLLLSFAKFCIQGRYNCVCVCVYICGMCVVCVCMCMYVCMCVCVYVCMCMYVCMYVCIVYMCMCLCTCMCVSV